MSTAIRPGTRMKCGTCNAEFVIVKPAEPQLTCCGAPVEELAKK